MRSEDRRDLATATVGAGALAGGGVMRHKAVQGLKKEPKVHLVGILRNGSKGQKRLFTGGSALGLAGTAPLAVGTTRFVTGRDIEKADWRERAMKSPGRKGTVAGLSGMGIGVGLGQWGRGARFGLPPGRRAPVKPWEPKPKKELTEAQRRGAVNGGRASSEIQREKRTGQHRSLQAMQRYENRPFNLEKRDKERGFLAEGLRGSVDALGGRAESALNPVPKDVRAMQLGVAAGAGLGGSALARQAMKGSTKIARPALAPVAGGLAATATLPLTNKLAQKKGYEVTATGVRRAKTPPKRASSRAVVVDPRRGPTRMQIVPSDERFAKRLSDEEYEAESQSLAIDLKQLYRAEQDKDASRKNIWAQQVLAAVKYYEEIDEPDLVEDASEALATVMGESWYRKNVQGGRKLLSDVPAKGPRQFKRDAQGRFSKAGSYLGSRTDHLTQRGVVTAASHPPIIGPLTQAAAAGKYAPPGQERKHAVRQYALGSGLGVPMGVAGAYGGARLAGNSPKIERKAQGLLNAKEGVENAARRVVGMGPKQAKGPTAYSSRAKARFLGTRPGKALMGPNPAKWGARGVGATAGFFGVKALTGAVGGQTAITLNQRDQSRYNRQHGIVGKAAPTTGQTKREKTQLAERKRISAALSAVGGAAGLTGVSLLAAGKKGPATTAGIIGGGFGGANALLNTPIQRSEAKAIDPVKKLDNVVKGMPKHVIFRGKKARVLSYDGDGKMTVLGAGDERFITHRDRVAFPKPQRSVSPDSVVREGEQLRLPFEKRAVERRKKDREWRKKPRPSFGERPGTERELWRQEYKDLLALESADSKGLKRREQEFAERLRRAGTASRSGKKRKGGYVVKRDSLEIKHKNEHPKLLSRYGDKGPLPKGLSRDEKMKAYEARYVRHGGDKADKYGRRAERAEGVRNAGLVGATAGGAGWLAARTRRGKTALGGAKAQKLKFHADTAAVGAATVGGGAELYGEYARGRRASYTNSPAGVAGSALRRMRDYTPD